MPKSEAEMFYWFVNVCVVITDAKSPEMNKWPKETDDSPYLKNGEVANDDRLSFINYPISSATIILDNSRVIM